MLNPAIGARSVKRGLLIAKIYYFLFFGAVGCIIPFLNIYLDEVAGLTKIQIGWLNTIAPLVALVANPIWGTIADRWEIHRQVVALCALVAGVITLFFLQARGFWVFVGLVTVLTFFRTPIGAIVDSTVMDLVKRTNNSYGRQRLWGTVGFVITAWGLGQLLSVDDLSLAFWLHTGLLGVACVGLSFWLPIQRVEQKVGIRRGIGILLGQGNYLAFLIAVTLLGMGVAGLIGFLGLYIRDLGGTEQQVGLGWAANAVMEIPIMYLGARWFARYSYRRLILGSLFGFTLVWLLVGLSYTPTMVIVFVFGSGICFGAFWIAAVGYANAAAPPGLSATAQALTGAAMVGLGWSLGSVVAGYLWENLDGHAVFFFGAFYALLAALIFWWGSREE